MDFAKIVFLFNALTFDMYKWCVFLAGTSTPTVKRGASLKEIEVQESKQSKRINYIKIGLYLVQGGMMCLSITLITLLILCDLDVKCQKPLSQA
jgi:hypothetical protein